jgi:hypothetical protein
MSSTTLIGESAQRMRALERANQVRLARSDLKRLIARGEASVAEAILNGGPEIDGMAIIELLLSQRRWGHARARRLLMAIPMSENKTIGSMTERQRSVLAATLRAESPEWKFERAVSRSERSGAGESR